MMQFIADNLLLFYLVVLLSSIFSSSLGIGSFILIPLAAIFFGAKESIGIITLYFLFQNVNKLIFFWKWVNFPIAKKLIIWSIPGVIAGAFLLHYVPIVFFEKLLAIAIIVFIFNDVYRFLKKKQQKKSLPLFGLFYGFLSGLLGSGNLVKGPLFISLGLLKESYIGTYALTSFFMNIPKIGIYFWSGIISFDIIASSIPFLFISFFGTLLGRKVIKHIHNNIFYAIMVVFFVVTALILLLQ